MTDIQLNQNKIALIDEEDFERVSQFNWSCYKHRNTFVVHRRIKKENKITTQNMSRFILDYNGELCVDHINGNALDNRKENLRLCTPQENRMNSIKSSHNKSGFKGVYLRSDYRINKWNAQIKINKKLKSLGYFKTKEEAAIAYNNAAINNFGKFANLNIIMEN